MATSAGTTRMAAQPVQAKPAQVTIISQRQKHVAAYVTVVTIILAIYSYPALRTSIATKSLVLPPVTAPDTGLYLALSQIQTNEKGLLVNPYYHVIVPYPVSYLKFRLGPILFGSVNRLLAGRIWWSLFLWNLLCWLSLCLAAIWLFDRFLPNAGALLVLPGLCLITVFSLEGTWRLLMGTIHGSPDWALGLPYIRPFSPQLVMPLVFCYLGMQIRALERTSIAPWAMMALLQFLAFTAFPFATLMMAGTTAVAALWYVSARRDNWPWLVSLSFALICALSDFAYAMQGSGSFSLSFPEKTSLVRFEPSLLIASIGKRWVLIAVLLVATAVNRRLRAEIKWPLIGLVLTNLALALGDAFVSQRAFFMGNHIPYFYDSTIAILFTFSICTWMSSIGKPSRLMRLGSFAVIGVCCASGLIMAEGTYRSNLPFNLEQADMARWFARGDTSAQDLVITRFTTTGYDDCEWVPLLSPAEVLYCRNAQLALTADQNRGLQRLREVLYLYFAGKDRQWVQNTTAEFEQYGMYGEVSSFTKPENRTQRILALRQEMLPLFQRVEDQDSSMSKFFRRFRRVWIIENREGQRFTAQRLNSYLEIKRQEIVGSVIVTAANPK
jgi:hypothetical protein